MGTAIDLTQLYKDSLVSQVEDGDMIGRPQCRPWWKFWHRPKMRVIEQTLNVLEPWVNEHGETFQRVTAKFQCKCGHVEKAYLLISVSPELMEDALANACPDPVQPQAPGVF